MATERGARVFHGEKPCRGPLASAGARWMRGLPRTIRRWTPRCYENSAEMPTNATGRRVSCRSSLERAALSNAIVIGIDDIQWADAATSLTRSPSAATASLPPDPLAIRRASGELPSPAQLAVARIRAENADILTVNPLFDDAVWEVACDVLGGNPDEWLRSVISRVAGQPLWLVELLRGLRDECLVTVENGVARLVGDAIPRRLLESVSDQLARLSVQARQGMQMASVLAAASHDELASLMDVPASGLVEPVREALAAGLIVGRGDRLGFRHDLIREATEAELPVAVKRSLQRRALDVLLAHGAPPVDAATLVMEVARPGDDQAIELLQRAASRSGRYHRRSRLH